MKISRLSIFCYFRNLKAMANVCHINTPENIFHLNVENDEVVLTPGRANEFSTWQFNRVGNNHITFTIQHVEDGRFLQILADSVNLIDVADDNCQLTLTNGIGNNTVISNLNLNPHTSLQVEGRMIGTQVGIEGQHWNITR